VASFDDLSVASLVRRGSVKWSLHGPGVLAAWIAEMDFALAPPVRRALEEAVQRGFTGYPPHDEDSGIPEALAGWLQAAFGWAVDPAGVRLVGDVLAGIRIAIEALSAPASPVVVPTPSYPPFFEVVKVAGRDVVEVPLLRERESYRLDLDGIDRALGRGAGTVILCNPHNPLGRVFGREELAGLAAVVERHGARVIADEVHAPLVYEPSTFVPYVLASEQASSHCISLTSTSKGWNLPGLKCAQAVLYSEGDRLAWDDVSWVRKEGATTLGIAASIAAYTEGREWLSETVSYLDGNRHLLRELIGQYLPEVRWDLPEATYLAWLDCRELGVDEPAAFFLDKAHVALNEGALFGRPGKGFVRLNFATSRSILEKIVAQMAGSIHG